MSHGMVSFDYKVNFFYLEACLYIFTVLLFLMLRRLTYLLFMQFLFLTCQSVF